MEDVAARETSIRQEAPRTDGTTSTVELTIPRHSVSNESRETSTVRVIPRDRELKVSWRFGTILIVAFLATFITVMIVRGVIKHRPLLFSLFSNLYLAGTIIFGGGPVVIPLLRQ